MRSRHRWAEHRTIARTISTSTIRQWQIKQSPRFGSRSSSRNGRRSSRRSARTSPAITTSRWCSSGRATRRVRTGAYRNSAVVDNICGAGQSERSRWLGLGYTSQKLIDQACPATGTGGVIDAAALAFPDKFIAYAVGRISGLDPTQDYVAEHITQNARAKYGNRILIAKETLSQKTFENDPYDQQPANNGWTILWELPPCAAQMASDVTSPSGLARMSGQRDGGPVQVLTDAVNVGADYGTVYQEIYQDDVTNPVTAPVIAYAHGLLACPSPTPTPTATPTATPTPTSTPTPTPTSTPTPTATPTATATPTPTPTPTPTSTPTA